MHTSCNIFLKNYWKCISKAESLFLPEENVGVHRGRAGGEEGGGLLQVREGLQQVRLKTVL